MLEIAIVGAGICGLTLGRELAARGVSFALFEARERLGGTWDLFRYPGVRSDSDLYTFAYDFKPWRSRKAIASGAQVLAYLSEAAAEHGGAEARTWVEATAGMPATRRRSSSVAAFARSP